MQCSLHLLMLTRTHTHIKKFKLKYKEKSVWKLVRACMGTHTRMTTIPVGETAVEMNYTAVSFLKTVKDIKQRQKVVSLPPLTTNKQKTRT